MRDCVLVHGGWCGGWHWDEVAARLRLAGISVYAPTLAGLAERAPEAAARPGLETHVGDIVALLEERDLRDVVLVGHSYGGAVITGVAHRRLGRIAELVYLDAFVPRDGESMAPPISCLRCSQSRSRSDGRESAPRHSPHGCVRIPLRACSIRSARPARPKGSGPSSIAPGSRSACSTATQRMRARRRTGATSSFRVHTTPCT